MLWSALGRWWQNAEKPLPLWGKRARAHLSPGHRWLHPGWPLPEGSAGLWEAAGL